MHVDLKSINIGSESNKWDSKKGETHGNKRKYKPSGRQEDLSQHSKRNKEHQPQQKEIQRRNQVMTFGLYVIKDELSNFGFPQAFANDDVTKREMKKLVDQPGMIQSSPQDFSYWKIGEYNSDTGVVTAYPQSKMKLVCRGTDFKKGETHGSDNV